MKAQCLVLDKRWEEFKTLRDDCEKNNIDVYPYVAGDGKYLPAKAYDLIDEPNPDVSRWGYGRPHLKKHHYNAFRCHQQMVARAIINGWDGFLMLEDDAYITDRYSEVVPALVDAITQVDPDILYYGWWIGNEGDAFNNKIEEDFKVEGKAGLMKAIQIGGLHGAYIKDTMYDTILRMDPINPIDAQLNNLHSKIKSYCIYPKVVHTKSIYSFCEDAVINRHKL